MLKRIELSHLGAVRAHVFRAAALVLAVAATLLADQPESSAPPEPPVTVADREHWAFRPVVRPEPPAMTSAEWCRTTIDRFILAKIEAAALVPQPPADRATLIRRVAFDLTGLPPTPA
ncbi:MAG TPA: DUF1549 domain-containing protein, partial [Planctomycetaceae bacterium]|nr:DUF1549 domain-containing protein [Planctomycetaceae bacterium]